MCGIAGFWLTQPTNTTTLQEFGTLMAGALAQRGPDDQGVWVDGPSSLVLSHRRLAIVDLSQEGHQPMVSSCGRYVMVYNGEIYNAPDLRQDLRQQGRSFRGTSDTEVILEGCAVWGAKATAQKLIGMFAFALWDKEEKTLTLLRDRLGIKPLYWGRTNSGLFFGSTLHPLEAMARHSIGPVSLSHNEVALKEYLFYQYVPAPLSIYQGIEKLLPGQMVTIGPSPFADPQRATYWSVENAIKHGKENPLDLPDDELVRMTKALLKDAVKRRMVADVPLGAFLSGGIDSSLVVALMQDQSVNPIRTFSIGFEEAAYNEAPHAKAVAEHLGTQHTEVIFSENQAMDMVDQLMDFYDEPFADSSQLPTYLVSSVARRHVTVSLSGDGGDELFAGYNRYAIGYDMWKLFRRFPKPLRPLIGKGLSHIPGGLWQAVNRYIPMAPRNLDQKAQKVCRILNRDSLDHFYQDLIWCEAQASDFCRAPYTPRALPLCPQALHDIESMQYWDLKTYLPDDILAKVDRASMAVGLEARVPLLDHRVVELSWQLPYATKIREGQTKWMLRQILDDYVPRSLMERPKMGFGIPLQGWLHGGLREWARNLLSPEALKDNPILDPTKVQNLWRDFEKNGQGNTYFLWTLLMMQSWLGKRKAG